MFSTGGSPSRRTLNEARNGRHVVGATGTVIATGTVMKRGHVDSGYLPGALTYVYRKGHLVRTGMCGRMEIGRDKPLREDAIFRIYSMTKPIPPVAFMMLLEEGRS